LLHAHGNRMLQYFLKSSIPSENTDVVPVVLKMK
jgi:hypothetical protein